MEEVEGYRIFAGRVQIQSEGGRDIGERVAVDGVLGHREI